MTISHEDVAEKSINFFEQIRPYKSENSYTTIASLFDAESGELISFATGTKANNAQYQFDIEDCHAESLLKRAFKRYLISSLETTLGTKVEYPTTIKSVNCKFKSKLILFVSKFPCGLDKRYEGPEHSILRKPGRGKKQENGKILYVEKDPCYIKLVRWISEGIQGKKLYESLKFKANIIKVVIGNNEGDMHCNYAKNIDKMMEDLNSKADNQVEVVFASSCRREELIFKADKRPYPGSIVWWYGKECNKPEIIVNGRPQGMTKKVCQRANISSLSRLCGFRLEKDRCEMVERLFKAIEADTREEDSKTIQL